MLKARSNKELAGTCLNIGCMAPCADVGEQKGESDRLKGGDSATLPWYICSTCKCI